MVGKIQSVDLRPYTVERTKIVGLMKGTTHHHKNTNLYCILYHYFIAILYMMSSPHGSLNKVEEGICLLV